MTTQFTPGPWFAELGVAHNVVFAEKGVTCIATVHHDVLNGTNKPQDYNHASNANTQLIAAAPSLLEACQLAAPVIDSWLNGQGVVTEQEMDAALLALTRALRAAKGLETP